MHPTEHLFPDGAAIEDWYSEMLDGLASTLVVAQKLETNTAMTADLVKSVGVITHRLAFVRQCAHLAVCGQEPEQPPVGLLQLRQMLQMRAR